MAEFFRGWKRNVGVVTLVVACATMLGWARSECAGDRISIRAAGQLVVLWSLEGCFKALIRDSEPDRQWSWPRWSTAQGGYTNGVPVFFDYSTAHQGETILYVPHHVISIALALLSAALLISKPKLAAKVRKATVAPPRKRRARRRH